MGFIAPVVQGITGLISGISAWKNAKKAGQQNALMQQAQQQQMGALGQVRQQGGQMYQMGMPATTNALNYYAALLSGNRAKMAQAVAGPTAALTDQYRGAVRGLEHMGIRGGERATALAELNRERYAQTAGLTTGVQPMAAGALGSMGTTLMGNGTTAITNAASGYNSAAQTAGGQAQQYAQQGREDLAGVGKSIGGILDWWKNRNPGPGPTPYIPGTPVPWTPGSGSVPGW